MNAHEGCISMQERYLFYKPYQWITHSDISQEIFMCSKSTYAYLIGSIVECGF